MLDWNKVIEQALATATIVVPAVIGGMIKLRKLEQNQQTALENQERIEEKADGQHTRQLEEIKKAGKYEGAQEAKQEASFTAEQISRAVEQVLAAQAKLRGRRRNDG